jgi:predicted alpha/beta superfamily hydrolase
MDGGIMDGSVAVNTDGGEESDGGADDASDMHDGGHPDGGPLRTTIRIVYPAGSTITVRGSGGPLNWDTGLSTTAVSGEAFVHELTTTEITEPLEWKPLLGDATWSRGPNYHVSPGDTIEVAPHFSASGGRVEAILSPWSSDTLGTGHTVWAYLPPSYDENTAARYPVVYMQDGQNLFDASVSPSGAEWQVDEALDYAASAGRCSDGATCQDDSACATLACTTFREAIVIGIESSDARVYDYTPTEDTSFGGGGGADTYLDAVVDELKPMIDATYRTQSGSADTALIGSSLGGILAAHGGITHSEVFGLIGALSPSTWWDGRMILSEVASVPSRSSRALRVYVDSGDGGPGADGAADTVELAAAYRAVGYVEGTSLHYLLAPGDEHHEIYWARRLPGTLTFLLGPRERPL